MTAGSSPKDPLGDRMKAHEATATSARFDGKRPVYARIDGRNFSGFTRGMTRPFDADMSRLMQDTTSYLVEKTGARLGFTQSDEISLVFLADETPESMMFFGGRQFKLTSQLAAMATARFLSGAMALWPERCDRNLPTFDARVFELPSREEATYAVLWRFLDCERNAISMVAQSMFAHRELQGVGTREQLTMIRDRGVEMTSFPEFFTYGTFVRRVEEMRELTDDERAAIPEGYAPEGILPRSTVVSESINMRRLANIEAFVFDGEEADLSRVQAGFGKRESAPSLG